MECIMLLWGHSFSRKKTLKCSFIIKVNCSIVSSDPNGHIFVQLPSILRRNITWKIRRNFIDFERRIHVEIMTPIRRGNFNVGSTFKIDKISMSSPHGFFYVVSMSNQCNYCTHWLFPIHYFLTSFVLGTYSKVISYSAESM